MSDTARDLADAFVTESLRLGANPEDRIYYRKELKIIITQAIQQALDEQAAEGVALREALRKIFEAGYEESAEILGRMGQQISSKEKWMETYCPELCIQPSPRAAQIMAVVERVKKLAAIKKRVKESEAIIKPIPSDFWPLIHDLADMGEALEGGA
jgi:hypothetical protein